MRKKFIFYHQIFCMRIIHSLILTDFLMSPVDHPLFNNYWRLKVTQRAANDFAINDFYKSMTSSNNVFMSAYVYLKVHTLSNSKC